LKGLSFGAGVFVFGGFTSILDNLTLPSYARVDALLAYRRDNWRVQLNVQNLFDTVYYEGFGVLLEVGAPLTIRGTVSYTF
jgi:iron complex outermembrane receptor protein